MLMRRPRASLIDRMFEDMFSSMPMERFTLPLDVIERENEYVVTTTIAGVNPEDIEVKLDDDVLSISAEIHEESKDENERTLIRERRYGKFSRSIRFGLPVQGENIEADYDKGVLTLRVPKAEASQPKRINVKYNKG